MKGAKVKEKNLNLDGQELWCVLTGLNMFIDETEKSLLFAKNIPYLEEIVEREIRERKNLYRKIAEVAREKKMKKTTVEISTHEQYRLCCAIHTELEAARQRKIAAEGRESYDLYVKEYEDLKALWDKFDDLTFSKEE